MVAGGFPEDCFSSVLGTSFGCFALQAAGFVQKHLRAGRSRGWKRTTNNCAAKQWFQPTFHAMGHAMLDTYCEHPVVAHDTYMPLFTLSGGARACSQKVVLRKRFRSLVDRFGPLYRPIAW